MGTITLDITAFRAAIPQYANATQYPDLIVTANFDMATGFVSADTYGCMTISSRTYALYLMTAHLMRLGELIAANNYTGTPGTVTQATIDKVSVTLQAPPSGTSQWRWWLNLTPYGAQLLALLGAQAVGGFYIGGRPERAAFRKVGGYF